MPQSTSANGLIPSSVTKYRLVTVNVSMLASDSAKSSPT